MHSYYNIIDYLPYAVCYILETYSFDELLVFSFEG